MNTLANVIIGAICLLSSFFLLASEAKSTQVRAAMLYHIAEFTYFPAPDLLKQINMCFLEAPLFEHAVQLKKAKKQTVNGIPFNIIKLANIDAIAASDCHLLFVSKEQQSKQLFAQLDEINQQTLTIGESLTFIEKGGVLSIVPGNTNMQIMINMRQLKYSPFKINSAVVNLATLY